MLTTPRFCCALHDTGYCLAVCLLQALLWVVGVSVDEPMGPEMPRFQPFPGLDVLEHWSVHVNAIADCVCY